MSNSDQQKPGTKSGKRKQKRSQKPHPAQSPVPDQPQAAKELIDAATASAETSSAVAAAMAEPPPSESVPTAKAPPVAEVAAPPVAEAAPAEAAPADTTKQAETSPVGLQTIATAYRDYTRKSIEDAQSYVEKLSGVRSLDKAMEVQTEFAKQAYETFTADSRKICGLYGEFFKQTLRLPKSPFDRAR